MYKYWNSLGVCSKKIWIIFLAFFFMGTNFIVFAQGDLMVYPTRLVFEGNQNRIQIINLNNRGKDTATYKLSYIENRMNEEGHFEIIKAPDVGQNFASPYLRFYPQMITLAPNESQVVKVQVMKTNNLSRGEYRSHLYFRPVPRPEALEDMSKVSSEGISISLKPIYGVSIANIILIDDPTGQVVLTNLGFEKYNNVVPILTVDFHRSGEASSYGNIMVEHIAPSGERTLVGESKGFAVYTPGKLRKTRLELRQLEQVNYNDGKLVVKYVSQGDNKVLLAEGTLEL